MQTSKEIVVQKFTHVIKFIFNSLLYPVADRLKPTCELDQGFLFSLNGGEKFTKKSMFLSYFSKV